MQGEGLRQGEGLDVRGCQGRCRRAQVGSRGLHFGLRGAEADIGLRGADADLG